MSVRIFVQCRSSPQSVVLCPDRASVPRSHRDNGPHRSGSFEEAELCLVQDPQELLQSSHP